MHRCLSILDVLLAVFEDDVISPADLASLARTCKTFSGPALDILWRYPACNIATILGTMAPDLWSLDMNGFEEQLLSLKGPISSNHWTRLMFYADRIRSLCFAFCEDTTATDSDGLSVPYPYQLVPDAIIALMSSAPSFPVARNLKTLHINIDSPETLLSCVRLFLGPSVTDLRLIVGKEDVSDLGDSLVSTMVSMCPNVKTAHLFVDTLYTAPYISDLVWPQIEQFTCEWVVTASTLLGLSVVPTLRRLDVQWDPTTLDTETITSASQTTARFSKLQWLTLRCREFCSLGEISRIMRLSRWPGLESFEVRVLSDPGSHRHVHTASDWYTLIAELSDRCSTSVLKRIVLEGATWPAGFDDSSLRIASLAPLFSFPHLTHLTYAIGFPLDLEDADLETMARAWPALESLQISKPYRWKKRSGITMRGLANFLGLSPNLHHLDIYIDATTSLSEYPMDSLALANHKITEITVGESDIKDSVAIAVILSGVLPNLRRISATSGDRAGVTQLARWREVERMLDPFAVVRKDERKRCIVAAHGGASS
ncbi:hypothetical protein PLICRDRAFT_382355 [Plicaturopsis crispa FD-325 SS-3]|nr:hypothetical protein PLICRDRAFT_382355 [Plicaturopsis crispa FD-325 SS-3]